MAAPSPKGIGADACFASRDIGAYGDEVNARTSDPVGSWVFTEGRRWGHVLTRRAAAGAHYGGTGARRSCKQDRQARPAARAARGGVTPTRRPPSRAAKLRGPARGAPKNQGRNGSISSAACAPAHLSGGTRRRTPGASPRCTRRSDGQGMPSPGSLRYRSARRATGPRGPPGRGPQLW